MLIFLIMSFLYFCGWGAMFASTSFRWTFKLWRFFSIITSASVLLTLTTFVIGLMCRMNFGKGLSRYCGCSLKICVMNLLTINLVSFMSKYSERSGASTRLPGTRV